MFRKKEHTSGSSLSALAWLRFKKNKIALFFLWFIAASVLVATLGYLIIPDPSPYSNTQHLELAARQPGFSITMLKVKKQNQETTNTNFLSTMLFGKTDSYTRIPLYSYQFKGDNIIIETYTGMQPNDGEIKTFSLQQITGLKDQSITSLQNQVKTDYISQQHFWLGTDKFGRDMLSRLVIGTRVSLAVGFISVLISLIVGITLGAVAGYFKGWVDNVIVWLINVVWSIPTLLLVIAITFALGKGFWQIFIAVGLTMWVEVARMVRGQVLSIREKEFVEAARAMGFGDFRIIFKHILPNVMSAVIVISAANFASAILIEAGLSFLGIGVQPPMPSWGTMIKEHYPYIILNSAFLAILPGIAIMLMVLAFMSIGNGLRDALDIKIR